MNLNWYAVYTKPRWEKKVAETLTRHRIENYCPLNRVIKQWSDRKRMVEEPLFTSYVFVAIPANQQHLVKQIDGIVNFVSWMGKPAVIRDEDIATIKNFLKQYENVKLEQSRLNLNDRVRVIDGPFTEYTGEVVAVKSKTVKLLIPALGFTMVAELERTQIEPIRQGLLQPLSRVAQYR